MPFPKPKIEQPPPSVPDATGDSSSQGFQFPPDHQPGMQVPKGGSSCSSCKYLGQDGASCTNEYFIQWNGSPQLPNPADEYCSDWYEPGAMQDASEETIGSAGTENGSPAIGVAEEQA